MAVPGGRWSGSGPQVHRLVSSLGQPLYRSPCFLFRQKFLYKGIIVAQLDGEVRSHKQSTREVEAGKSKVIFSARRL